MTLTLTISCPSPTAYEATQLRLSQRRLVLLINFGEVHFRNEIERLQDTRYLTARSLPEETPTGFGSKGVLSLYRLNPAGYSAAL